MLIEITQQHEIRIQTAGLAFGGTGLCSCRVRGVDGSCTKHLTVESYMDISTSVSSANTDEPIEMLCGWQICVGPMNYVLRGMQNGATLRIRLNDSCARRCGFTPNYFCDYFIYYFNIIVNIFYPR